MVQAVIPEPPDSGVGVEGQHEPKSIPVSSDDDWNKMMVDAQSAESNNEEIINKKLEDVVAVAEAAASCSMIHFAPPCSTTSQLLGQRQEIEARHRAEIATGSGHGFHQFEEAQQEMRRMNKFLNKQKCFKKRTNE